MPGILICDDSEHARKVLSRVLSIEHNWKICGEAKNGHQAVLMTDRLKPDLVILDVSMPILDGLHAAEEILKSTPRVPIILYTLHENAQLDFEAKRIGVRKVISKLEPIEILVEIIREQLSGPHPSNLARDVKFSDSFEPRKKTSGEPAAAASPVSKPLL
jgi:DNA-binding NarL/FixJ family response regulator